MAFLSISTAQLHVPIVVVGLDVDGVARDTAWLAYQNCCLAIEQLGGTPPKFEDFVHGWCGSLGRYYRSCGVTAPIEEIHRVNHDYIQMSDNHGPFSDVDTTLEYLQSCSVRLFALSGHTDSNIQAWFAKHNLHTRFEHIQGDGSDKADHLRAICKKFGVDPTKACYLGDWGQDMRAAKEVGMIPIGVARSYKTHNVLRRNGAAHVIDHLHELCELIH